MNSSAQHKISHLATAVNAQEVAAQLFRNTGEDHVVLTNDDDQFKVYPGKLLNQLGADRLLPNSRIVTICTGEGGDFAHYLTTRPQSRNRRKFPPIDHELDG